MTLLHILHLNINQINVKAFGRKLQAANSQQPVANSHNLFLSLASKYR